MKKIKWLAVLASLLCGAVFAETTTPDGETAEGDGANFASTANLFDVGDVQTATITSTTERYWSVSSQPANATVTVTTGADAKTKTPVVTIVAKATGSKTVTINGANTKGGSAKDYWTLTVNVVKPTTTLDIDLCVDDKVVFGQRQTTACRWKNASTNTAVATVSQTDYTGNANNCDATITAVAAGKTAVMAGWYTRSGSGGNYTYTLKGYNLYNVTVGAAREVKLGGTTNVVCKTPVTGTAWSETGDTNGRATVALSTTTSSEEETTATITGVKEGAATVTVTDYNNGSSAKTGATYTLKLTVVDPREKHNEAITVVEGGKTVVTATSTGESAWGISSADTTIATVDSTKIAATESATFEVAGVKAGDTTVAATNAAAIWNYAVTVYDTNTVDLVVTNGAPRTVTCTSEKAATWSVASSDTGVVTVSGSSATATINATVTGVAVGDAVVTVSNKYQITTINVRVVAEPQTEEKEINISDGGTVELESPVKAKWTATYDDTIIKSVKFESLDRALTLALTATKDGPEAKKVEVTIEPQAGLTDGTKTTMTVSNGYTTYTLNLTITKPTETKSLPISCGAAWTNELEGVMADYTAVSADPAIATVEIVELEDTTNLVITAIKNGNTKVTVDGPTKTVVYEVIVSTVEIEKTVKSDPDDWSNATIRVAAHIDYVKNTHTNNILFIGSTCTSHGLGGVIDDSQGRGKTSNVVRDAARDNTANQINTIAKKGRVKWFLFGNNSSSASVTDDVASGIVEKGLTVPTGTTKSKGVVTRDLYAGGLHRNLLAYLTCLKNALDAEEKPDYIVLSFDGGRLAKNYPTADRSVLEASVAEKLEDYYKNGQVIWITEKYPVEWDQDPNEQWGDYYYLPSSTMDDDYMTQQTWEAMVAMLDPVLYNSRTSGNRWNDRKENVTISTQQGTRTVDWVWAATRNEIQTTYNDPGAVKEYLDKYIKDVSFDSEVKDKVVTSVGDSLTIPEGADKVRFYIWAGETAPAKPWADQAKNTHWQLVTPSPVEIGENNQITVVTSNIAENAYMLLEIDVLAKEDLIEKAKQIGEPLCKWDDAKQVWVIDPNDGEATLSLSRNVEGEEPQLYAKGSGATLTKWNIPAQPIVISATDYFDVYDGEAHTIDFTVDPDENPSTHEETQVRFSTDNSNWTVWTNYSARAKIWPTWTDCCTSNKVYIEARCLPGYADTNALAYVTITQRVLKVTATDASKTYGGDDPAFEWTLSGDVLAKDRETVYQNLSNSASIVRADYPAGKGNKAGTYTDVLGSNGVFSATGNYKVEFEPGDFTINPAELTLTAKGYSGVYDGEGHTIGLEINVTNDTFVTGGGGSGIFIRTSTDNTNWSKWTKWPVGDVKDILPKATNVADTVMTVYVQATSAWAVTGALSMDYKPNAVGNYKPTSASATVTITPVSAELTAGDLSKDYGADDPDPNTATVTTNGVIAADAGKDLFVYTMSMGGHDENPGKKKGVVRISGEKNQGNYTLDFFNGTLLIGPKPPSPSKGCEYKPDPVKGVAWVYVWKFSGKTSVGALTSGTKGTTSACSYMPGLAGCVIRVPGSLAIKGYSYVCEPECMIDDKNQFIDLANWSAHDFYMTKPYKDLLESTPEIAVANVIGRMGGKFELAGSWELQSKGLPNEKFVLSYAGLGSYTASKSRVSSVSGKFVGTGTQPYYIPAVSEVKAAAKKGVVGTLCIPAIVWDCAVENFIDDDTTVAYGNWSVKYESTASKAYYANGKRVKLPAWAESLRKR